MNLPYVVGMDMVSFMQRFSTDEACRAFLEWVRWPNGPVCPKCGSVGRASRLRSRPGTWGCCVGACKAQFSVTAGTPLHRTRVPLTKWFLAIWLISTSSKGVSGMKLSEWLDVDYRTAWYMGHRIRRLLADPDWRKLSGIVEADEMYVGGRKKPEDDDPGAGSGGSKRGRGHGRAVVLIAAERGGDVRVRRIATHSSIEIGNAVRELIDPSARLITDGLPAYRRVGRTMAEHVTVDHGRRRFSDGNDGHVNTTEGLIGLFRRSVQGTWHWVSEKHLDAYTTECTWRHNRRHVSAATKFVQALGGLDAGPLSYRELVACG
jgi:transposase-like protein